MRIFVAGGTGAIGRPLVTALVRAGHAVTATTHRPERAETLRALGATPALVDGLDAAAIRAAVDAAKPDVVVHQMTAIPAAMDLRRVDDAFERTNRLRTEGTRHLLDAAARVGARVVAQSFAGWPYLPEGGPVKTEDDPFMERAPRGMQATLDAIKTLETLVMSTEQGTVLRYAFLYGPGTSIDVGSGIVHAVRARKMPLVGDGAGVWSFVHVDDAAGATVAAVERGATGTFNVADDRPAPVRTWLPALARVVGAPTLRRVPAWLARLAIGPGGVHMMTTNRGASNAKVKGRLGWQPMHPDWEAGFATCLAPDRPERATRPRTETPIRHSP